MIIVHPDGALELYSEVVKNYTPKVPSHPNPIHKITNFHTTPFPATNPNSSIFLK